MQCSIPLHLGFMVFQCLFLALFFKIGFHSELAVLAQESETTLLILVFESLINFQLLLKLLLCHWSLSGTCCTNTNTCAIGNAFGGIIHVRNLFTKFDQQWFLEADLFSLRLSKRGLGATQDQLLSALVQGAVWHLGDPDAVYWWQLPGWCCLGGTLAQVIGRKIYCWLIRYWYDLLDSSNAIYLGWLLYFRLRLLRLSILVYHVTWRFLSWKGLFCGIVRAFRDLFQHWRILKLQRVFGRKLLHWWTNRGLSTFRLWQLFFHAFAVKAFEHGVFEVIVIIELDFGFDVAFLFVGRDGRQDSRHVRHCLLCCQLLDKWCLQLLHLILMHL